MKRIIFFDSTLRQGGAERVISILSDKMVDEGFRTEIVLYYDSEQFYQINDKVKIACVCKETGSKNLIKNMIWMRRYFRKNSDIVISFLAPFNMIAIVSTLFSKVKIVVADRNDPRFVPRRKFVRRLRDFLYLFADGIVLQNTRNQKYFKKRIQEKSITIFNLVDLKEKAGLGLRTEKKKLIVSVGRLIEQKNPFMLIKAFEQFSNTHPDYKLVCYGEGDQREKLQRYIDENQLSDRISLPGVEKNIFEKISCAEMYILSSTYEGMPNSLIEAMCLGLSVISTRVSGADDLITHKENGLLIDINDDKQLLEAMLELADNEALRRKLAKKAVEWNERLDANLITGQWIDYICRFI